CSADRAHALRAHVFGRGRVSLVGEPRFAIDEAADTILPERLSKRRSSQRPFLSVLTTMDAYKGAIFDAHFWPAGRPRNKSRSSRRPRAGGSWRALPKRSRHGRLPPPKSIACHRSEARGRCPRVK